MTTPFDEDPLPRPRSGWMASRMASLRASFLTGIVVIAPVGLTVWLIWTVIGWVDGFVWPFVPQAYQPEALLNRFLGIRDASDPDWISVNVRGVGVIVFLLFTLLVGWIAKGLIGRSLVRYAESLVERVPVVRSIYSGVKQIAETVFNQEDRSFEKACLIQYPRKGIWAIGFISTTAKGEISRRAETGGRLMSIFVPTTPNPTSGFLLFFPEEDVIELDMTVEQAAKLVISAGLVYPNGDDPTKPPRK
ncbi:MAG: DUF502 domain-containing protein [Marinovum algicola]|jgi:uncharacterized membrane protein|uniref:Uncharacterized membrane protein n=3 Tax=Marinovum algicola TaxID=42444 RepID=A0A975W8M7_9RHOB|nr:MULTISPECIES: DUF502 domain-containing protein [Marinovum]AKO97076.1 hypothetical protein MALG_01907 [Marinovum algicola DG 898]MDD9738499.1 DUF502 domain-containing protein [Marinovum sp. SP66]MDD9742560.1 DUF502 domain-containing protein [Marinovum sp. PR37]SEJ12242.1 Uncharacterized membrane protein [Marinovum algicola]SLN21317.1 hypothetical protein MAA5396_00794 [Marinovum algicola]